MRKRVVCTILLITILLSSCTYFQDSQEYYGAPQYGVWYCEELQLQLNFNKGEKSIVLVDGNEVLCGVENDRGSAYFSVAFLYGNYYYDHRQIFFRADCDYWDEEKMIVTELIDKEIIDDGFLFKGNQYTFVRVDKPQEDK